MAFMDRSLDAPENPDKGHEGGSCNRRSCQAPNAIWWNHGSHSWYCADCRRDIEFDTVNLQGWQLRWQPQCGHPMFETREMMDAREAAKAPDIDKLIDERVGPYFGYMKPPPKPKSSSLERMLCKAKRRG